MWGCTRLWLLFIALLHLKDVRALGVWSKSPAEDWYSVDGKTSLDQLQETASFPDGAQTSTALRDESKTNAGVLQTKIDLWAGLSSSEALTNGSFGYYKPVFPGIQAFRKQNVASQSRGSTVYGLSQGLGSQYGSFQTQQDKNQLSSAPALTLNQQASGMSSSSHTGSQSTLSDWLSLGLSRPYVSFQTQQGTNQLGSAPALTVTQKATEGSTTANGSSTSSLSSAYSGSQGSTGYGLSQGLASQYGGGQSSPAIVTQQASGSAVSSGSTSSTSSSHSGSQSRGSTVYGLSQGFSRPFGSFQTQQGTNQLGSAPTLTGTRQATVAVATANGSFSSSSSFTGSRSPSSNWPSLGLSRPYGSFQTQQGTNQLSSAPALTGTQQASGGATTANGSSTSSLSSPYIGSQSSTGHGPSQVLASQYGGGGQSSSAPAFVTQQASGSAVYSGSTSSTSSSFHGSQSRGSTGYGPSHGLASLYGHGQSSSAPALTVSHQASEGATTANGSSGLSSSFTGSPSPTAYWLLLRLSSQYAGSPAQQGKNQLGSVAGLNVTQQASASPVLNGSTSSTSSSYSGSQRRGSTVYGLSQGFSSPYGSIQTQQGTNQLSSAPPLTLTQQASGMSSSSHNGSQSRGSNVYGLFQGFSRPFGSFQTQQGTNQQTTEAATTANGSSTSSFSRSFTSSQGPTAYWLVLRLPSQYAGSQAQQGINQLSSVPGLNMIQQASANAVLNGSTSSTSSPYIGSQGSTGYGPSQVLASQYGGGGGQSSSAPAFVTQQASGSAVSSGSTPSTSSSFHGSPSQSSTGYGLSQGLGSRYSSFHTQQGTNQLTSAPALTLNLQASGISFSSHNGSRSPSSNWPSLGLSRPYGSFQMLQGTNQQTTEAATTANGSSTSSLSSPYIGSQSSTGYGPSQVLASQYGGGQSSSAPAFVTQQASGSAVSSGSTSSTSTSYSGSQSQGPTVYGLSQGFSRPYGSFQTQQGTNRQTTEAAATANGSSSSSSSFTGSQSPSSNWPSLGISRPYVGFQTQQGINQLGSVPGLNVIQQVSASAALNGSTSSTSSYYSGSQRRGSTVYGLSQGFSSPYGSFQTHQDTNRQTTEAATTANGSSTSSLSSSYTGSQSQTATAYGSSHSLSNLYDGLHKQHGVQWLSSVPALTVNQQASGSTITSNGSNTDASSAYSAPQSHSLSHGLVGSSLSIPNQNVQQLGAFNQLVPSLWLGQQSCEKTVQ
ncbi:serine-rich adhesin for platelets isoform X2 [Ictalurus punctatus]|uniref:Serine-rich adhesin for platelets isoform X1 n=1 Tax=Ictalurus punctatus TaxID=7998 RepID=A0A9F7TRL3_ICTPU|nr:serine-rich adhesin for platelets isoform X1 [Ictalurus punctatus]XP_053542821.1 serine-rich adhesin for platelets isoform X2 [Ictalurus punctatus]